MYVYIYTHTHTHTHTQKLFFAIRSSLYTEYIMQNARLDEAQAGVKFARKNINNLR